MAKRDRRNALQKAIVPAGFVGLAGIAAAGGGLLAMRNGMIAAPGFMLSLLAAQTA